MRVRVTSLLPLAGDEFSLAPGGEVHLSCSAETSRARCLQVLGGTSVKRVNGFEMKGTGWKTLVQTFPYGCLCQSGNEHMNGADWGISVLSPIGYLRYTSMYLCL